MFDFFKRKKTCRSKDGRHAVARENIGGRHYETGGKQAVRPRMDFMEDDRRYERPDSESFLRGMR